MKKLLALALALLFVLGALPVAFAEDVATPTAREGLIEAFTPKVDGKIEEGWGQPLSVRSDFADAAKTQFLAAWVAYDDDNIYFAYRAAAKTSTVTFGTGLYTSFFLDKNADGYADYKSDAAGDYLGWWYYKSEEEDKNDRWNDYAATWNGTTLKKDGRSLPSTVNQVGTSYVFEGEIMIPRSSVPKVDMQLTDGDPVACRFAFSGQSGAWVEVNAATKEIADTPADPNAPRDVDTPVQRDVPTILSYSPKMDGTVEEGWGQPLLVKGGLDAKDPSRFIAAWMAYDEDNIYLAYRATAKKVLFGTSLYTSFFLDKGADGAADWKSDANGDYLGWWYYLSEDEDAGEH